VTKQEKSSNFMVSLQAWGEIGGMRSLDRNISIPDAWGNR